MAITFAAVPERSALADENLGVADDLDAMRVGELHRPMRLGMGERHAGGQHQRIDRAPIRLVQIAKRQSRRLRRLASALAIVPGQNRKPRPPASDRAAAIPDIPMPKTATVFPANEWASIMLPQLERGQAE